MKLDILAFAAHPDDVELSCSGTLLLHIASGKKVGIVDLTRGELGTRGNADIRKLESEESSKMMGISVRENMNFADGFFTVDENHQRVLIKIIRKYQPEIILANAIEDRHPDHGKAAKLVAEASFLSGLRKIETELNGEPQAIWRAKQIYNYIQDYYIKPDFAIDITTVMEKKIEVVKCFKSQFFDPSSNEPSTPISTADFIDFLYSRAENIGRTIGVKYAEGFTANRYPGVRSLFDLY